MNSCANKKPTFLWRGLLIVAPVLVLAAVGVFSARQDAQLARHEAADHAQVIADELLPKIGADLLARHPGHEQEFEVNLSGQLISPAPYSEVPAPRPLDLGRLTAEQSRLWRSAQAAEASRANPGEAARAYLEFLQSDPPVDFAAVARYAAGLFSAESGQLDVAVTHLSVLLEKYPDARGESGLPIKPLALVKLLELSRRGAHLTGSNMRVATETVCSNLVNEPTALTPRLLSQLEDQPTASQANAEAQNWQARLANNAFAAARAGQARAQVRNWQRVWREQEQARSLFAAAAPQLQPPNSNPEIPLLEARQLQGVDRASGSNEQFSWNSPASAPPRLFWFRAPQAFAAYQAGPITSFTATPASDNWLAIEAGNGQGRRRFVCRSEWEVGSSAKALVDARKHLPDYFGVGIEVAGKKLTWPAPDLRMWHEIHYMGGKGAGQVAKAYTGQLATTVLASAGNPTDEVKVSIYLTSPSAMLKYQRVRAFWFTTLIGAAAIAALVGLIAAYRAFQRQLRLSEMKSDFVSSVSHELRAPIASVRLMAESLEGGKVADPARQQEYFRFINQECRRLSSLIENVLDFSRIEQDRKQYELEPTDVLALTRRTVELMDTYAAERGVRLELVVPESAGANGDYQLSADGKALQQALINLIDNAIKHSAKDSTVQIGLELDTQLTIRNTPSQIPNQLPTPLLLLWVEDHGPGIPPEEHEKIFERFYRRGAELRRETQGVGIGLSIVKHIVEAHGGRVIVRSAVGQGSRFTIELPVSTRILIHER